MRFIRDDFSRIPNPLTQFPPPVNTMTPETLTPDAMMELLQTNMNVLWIAICAALVFFMQAGFAMLESGMVRSKNSINVIMKNYTDTCFGALVFWVVGYGLMFGTNLSGWYGTDTFCLSDGTPWDYSVLVFQMMFAATAVSYTHLTLPTKA